MAKFIPNPAGLAAATRQVAFIGELKVIAEAIKDEAIANAPSDEDEDTHYKEMIDTGTGVAEGIGRSRVNANKFTSAWIEFGNEHIQPGFRTLGNAAEAVGGELHGEDGASD